VRAHAFHLDDVDELFVRRFLREHGDELARDLVAHKDADLRAKNVSPSGARARCGCARCSCRRRASAPPSDLAVDGSTCSSSATRGAELGDACSRPPRRVVDDPTRNDRECCSSVRRRELR
jgi:hypothetical protein